MKISVQKQTLLTCVDHAADVLKKGNGKIETPGYQTIWLEVDMKAGRLHVSGQSMIGGEYRGNCPGMCLEGGVAGLHYQSFATLLKKLPEGQIILTSEDSQVIVALGKLKYKLPMIPEEYRQQNAQKPQGAAVAVVAGADLAGCLERVRSCMGTDAQLPALAGVSLKSRQVGEAKTVEIVALNGHQFAMTRMASTELHDMICDRENTLIHSSAIPFLASWLPGREVEVSISEKRIFFANAKAEGLSELVSFALSAEQFPRYEGFLDVVREQKEGVLAVNRKELLDALSRMQVFTTSEACGVLLDLQKTSATIKGLDTAKGSGQEQITAAYDGKIERISFPEKGLSKLLGNFQADTVELVLTKTDGPCGIKAQRGAEGAEKDNGYLTIIMPMNISEEEEEAVAA